MSNEEIAGLLEFLSPDQGRERRLALFDGALRTGRRLRKDWVSRLSQASWAARYEAPEVAQDRVYEALLEPPRG
jgi:hypothetical protein